MLGALRALSGYSWCAMVTASLSGETSTPSSMAWSIPSTRTDKITDSAPHNRKDGRPSNNSLRGTDVQVMEWYKMLPEPVFQLPSGGTKVGCMYCGSFSKGLVALEAFTILLEETPELGKTAEDDDVKTDDKEGLGGAVS